MPFALIFPSENFCRAFLAPIIFTTKVILIWTFQRTLPENEDLDIKSLRREFHSFQRETEENIDRVFGKFFIFAPMAFIGLIAAIVAVILRVFGYIQ